MKQLLLSALLASAALAAPPSGGGAARAEEARRFPVIQNYGGTLYLPDAAVRPEPGREYKLLFSGTRAVEEEGEGRGGNGRAGDARARDGGRDRPAGAAARPVPALAGMARLVNTFALYGVQPGQLRLVAVLMDEATGAVLRNEHHRRLFGTDNPNLDLIRQLKAQGARIYVCGNALAEHGYAREWVSGDVEVATAALTVLANYQMDGYALFPF